MDLTITTTTLGDDAKKWLKSAHGTEAAESVKIVVTSGDVTAHGTVLPSGICINRAGKVDADGDSDKVEGLLLEPIDISRGAGTYSGAMLVHGIVDSTQWAAKFGSPMTNYEATSIKANTGIVLTPIPAS